MKVLKISCLEGQDCHAAVVALVPNCISVFHLDNNHIAIEDNDYNADGSVKKSANLKSETNKIDPEHIDMINKMINQEWK